ncbi:MAG: RNA pseudouridine synthase [Alphaproteobacteria bacterium]
MARTAIRDDPSLLPTPSEMEARLLYRDASILILDKPAGIAVHPTGHDKVALDQAFEALRFGLPRPPALAHRLDRETSGCLALGRHRQALEKLGKLFAGQQVGKTYLAVVKGRPVADAGIIDAPILKSGQGSRWKLSIDPTGQEAITHYTLLGSDGEMSLLELSPKTGADAPAAHPLRASGLPGARRFVLWRRRRPADAACMAAAGPVLPEEAGRRC